MKFKIYERIPTRVQAIQWMGDNLEEIIEFAHTMQGTDSGDIVTTHAADVSADAIEVYNFFHERWVVLDLGDWLIYAGNGDFYPCRDSKFAEIYREAEDTPVEGMTRSP